MHLWEHKTFYSIRTWKNTETMENIRTCVILVKNIRTCVAGALHKEQYAHNLKSINFVVLKICQ